VGNCGVRSPGSKPKPLLFHPVAAGEEKTGGKIVRLPGSGAAAGCPVLQPRFELIMAA
jgi:hypothetical protein